MLEVAGFAQIAKAKGGSTFAAYDPNRGMTWVRRGTTRWWRLQVSGRDLTFVRLLDATHVLVRDIKTPGSPLAVVDLRRPTVDSPQVQQLPGGVTCVVPWTSSEATTSGYAWLRDGIVLRGATRSQRPRSRYDRVISADTIGDARTKRIADIHVLSRYAQLHLKTDLPCSGFKLARVYTRGPCAQALRRHSRRF